MSGTKAYALACLLLVGVATPGAVWAQAADRAAERADSRFDRLQELVAAARSRAAGEDTRALSPRLAQMVRLQALAAPAEEGPAPSWSVTFAAPVAFNSNPEHADGNTRGAVHADPSLELDFSDTLKSGALDASLAADADEYSARGSNDSSTVALSVGYGVVDKRLGGWIPYASYLGLEICGRGFGHCDLTLHTLSVGVKRAFDLTPNLAKGAKTTLAVKGWVARRASNNASTEQNRAGLTLSLGGHFNGTASWTVKEALAYAHYTGGTNDGRDDVNSKTTLSVDLDVATATTLSFAVQLERNSSDVTGKDYHAWDVGPSLSLIHTF